MGTTFLFARAILAAFQVFFLADSHMLLGQIFCSFGCFYSRERINRERKKRKRLERKGDAAVWEFQDFFFFCYFLFLFVFWVRERNRKRKG